MLQDQGIKPSFSAWEALGRHPLCVLSSCYHLLGTGFILLAYLLVLGVDAVTSEDDLSCSPALSYCFSQRVMTAAGLQSSTPSRAFKVPFLPSALQSGPVHV